MNETISTSVQDTAETQRGSGSPLDGRRVLFLPKNSRTPYFTAFLEKAREKHGWQIAVAGPEDSEQVWRGAIGPSGTYCSVPDFVTHQAWEKDDAAADDLDRFIEHCERASGISASRIILAGERDLGRGFSQPIYHWFHNSMARRVLADNTEPTRIVRRMFAFARDTLQAKKPDLLLAGEWADPLCFTFYLAARQMDIPCVVNRLSKLWSGRCYWSAGQLMYNDLARRDAQDRVAGSDPVSARAQSRIEEFRDRPNTLGYVQKNWDKLDSRGFFATHIDIARVFGVGMRHRIKGRGGPSPKPALRLLGDFYRRKWLKMRQSGFYSRFDESDLRDMRYIYIALHKDPEQALNYQAPFWSNQYNTISLLSSCLPDGYRLLVREHRNNVGRRPTVYYKDLLRLPGLILVDGFDDQFKYLRSAELVATENGSSGWEGLVLGRRVITLADTFYDGAGLARRIEEPEQMASAIVDRLERPSVGNSTDHDRALGCMLDAEWDHSAPLEDAGFEETLGFLSGLYSGLERKSTGKGSLSS